MPLLRVFLGKTIDIPTPTSRGQGRMLFNPPSPPMPSSAGTSTDTTKAPLMRRSLRLNLKRSYASLGLLFSKLSNRHSHWRHSITIWQILILSVTAYPSQPRRLVRQLVPMTIAYPYKHHHLVGQQILKFFWNWTTTRSQDCMTLNSEPYSVEWLGVPVEWWCFEEFSRSTVVKWPFYDH